MSSILKALKKVETDKRISKSDQLGIDARILQEGSSSRYSRTAATLVAIALFVCGCGLMYVYMNHKLPDGGGRLPAPQALSSRTTSISDFQTAGIPTTQKQSSTLQAAPPKSASITKTQPRKLKFPEMPPRTYPQEQQATTPLTAHETRPASTPGASGAATSSAHRPVLTVNGIAFQDGGSDNMAIINGSALASGAIIEGVRVDDILKDRVRFSHNGEKFDILLNKSNR